MGFTGLYSISIPCTLRLKKGHSVFYEIGLSSTSKRWCGFFRSGNGSCQVGTQEKFLVTVCQWLRYWCPWGTLYPIPTWSPHPGCLDSALWQTPIPTPNPASSHLHRKNRQNKRASEDKIEKREHTWRHFNFFSPCFCHKMLFSHYQVRADRLSAVENRVGELGGWRWIQRDASLQKLLYIHRDRPVGGVEARRIPTFIKKHSFAP